MESVQLRPTITELLQSVSKANNINNYKITNVETNEKGAGFMGEIYMVTITDNDDNKQLELVIKAAFINEKIRQQVPIKMAFQNEIYFYSTVCPKFRDLENEYKILQGPSPFAKLLGVSSQEPEEIVVLENLKSSGFTIFDKKLTLDHDHIKLIFEAYGRFHAYSYVLRDQKPEEFANIAANVENVFEELLKNPFFGDHLKEGNKLVETCLVPGEDDELIQKYANYSGEKSVHIFENVATQVDSYSAILHGDCWSNNMMFKYQEQKPTQIKIIDWQLVRIGSPVCDLSYCFYSGASKECIENLDDYLKIYYDTFSSFVRNLGSDPEKVFPFAVLKEHWKKFSKFGLIMSIDIIKMKLTDKENIVDFSDNVKQVDMVDRIAKAKFDKDEYKTRMRNILRHMSKLDAL